METMTVGMFPTSSSSMAPASSSMESAAARWWDRHFSAFGSRIPFKSLFFPLLLQVCDQHDELPNDQHQLSQDELAAIVKHCVAENAWKHGFVTKRDFLYFVARFGPLELTIAKVVSCFCVNGELVVWFHGVLGRAEADRVLATSGGSTSSNSSSPTASGSSSSSSSASGGDGTFLVRFSESHPTKFTLSYIKIHTSPPAHRGRREMKNCLIENLGLAAAQQSGGGGSGSYVLTDSRARAYSSILSFVQRSAGRLKYGVPSAVARHCNNELAEIRALQDQLSNSYTAFSAETFEMAVGGDVSAVESQKRNHSLLFAPPSPTMVSSSANSQQLTLPNRSSTGSSGGDCCADSYSGFTLDTLTPPLSIKTHSVLPSSTNNNNSKLSPPRAASVSDDYSAVGHFFNEPPASAKENNQQSHNAPPGSAMDAENADYGSFASFAAGTSASSGSPVAAAVKTRPTRLFSPSGRNPQGQPGFMLLSPSRRHHQGSSSPTFGKQQEDAYGTFESFASTFAAESEELARRNRQAISFSKSNMASSSSSSLSSFASTASSSGASSMGCDDPYGAFASLSITLPSTSASESGYGPGDYGNFASLVEVSSDSQQGDTGDFALGPPPPPLASQFLPRAQSSDADGYGSFAALTSSSSAQQEDNGLYGQFESETKVKQPSVLAQAFASSDEESAERQQASVAVVEEEQEPVHAHTAACSALEELNAGMTCYRDKQLDTALLRFIHAREVARATDDKVVEARALGNLGTVYLDKKNPQQAVVCYQRCLDITRSIKDTKRERTILNNLVLALMASEEFERALACCQVQLEMTTNEINRHKIFSRMSLLREKAARASKERSAAGNAAGATRNL